MPRAIFKTVLLSTLIALSITLPIAASAHEEGGEKEGRNWLVSHYQFGTLIVKPDESLEEWHGAKMLTLEEEGRAPISLMSIHNETYMLILVQSRVNSSLSNVGVEIRFSAEGSNRSMAVHWVWAGGHGQAVNGSAVRSVGVLNGSELAVVFGSPISSIGNGVGLKVGEPYSDFMRVVFWDNGALPSSMELSEAPPVGLELIPYIDHYPKLPILYSVVILVSGIGFIIMEGRKYTR